MSTTGRRSGAASMHPVSGRALPVRLSRECIRRMGGSAFRRRLLLFRKPANSSTDRRGAPGLRMVFICAFQGWAGHATSDPDRAGGRGLRFEPGQPYGIDIVAAAAVVPEQSGRAASAVECTGGRGQTRARAAANPDYSGPDDLHLRSATSGDIDGDGDIDLWVAGIGGANVSSHFMVNNADGTFTLDEARTASVRYSSETLSGNPVVEGCLEANNLTRECSGWRRQGGGAVSSGMRRGLLFRTVRLGDRH